MLFIFSNQSEHSLMKTVNMQKTFTELNLEIWLMHE